MDEQQIHQLTLFQRQQLGEFVYFANHFLGGNAIIGHQFHAAANSIGVMEGAKADGSKNRFGEVQ